MRNILLRTLAPLVSLFIIILGNSMMTTLLTVRLDKMGAAKWLIGFASAAFYGGLVIGSFRIEKFIARVGHIRAYAAFASILTVLSLIHGLWLNPYIWLMMRFIGGYCVAGIFVVIESWLLASSTVETRGQILAIYMTALYAGQSLGQFMLNLSDMNSLTPFCLIGILSSLSVVPLAITYMSSPHIEEPSVLNFTKLYKISPTGVIACFGSGLVLGAIYGLLPLTIRQLGYADNILAWLMGITILGGMMLQYPIGHVSDRMDRRKVLMLVCWFTVATSLCLVFFGHAWVYFFALLLFLIGGFSFVLYPLAISYACDFIEPQDIVAATGGLLLAYGVGATVGPLFAPAFMYMLGAQGLFVYFVIITGLLGSFILWRSKVSINIPLAGQQEFVVASSATPVGTELDPRADEKIESETI